MKKFFKKKIVIISIVAIVALIIGGYFYNKSTQKIEYDFIVLKKGELTQEVSVTGQVKPAESVDLAFERSGRVSRVNVQIGDNVTVGQLLTSLSNGELASDLLRAQANLEAEQARLSEIEAGTRPEELQQVRTDVSNAEIALSDKEANLENVRNQTAVDLESDYSSALSAVQNAVVRGKSAILTLSDIQAQHFSGSDQNSIEISDAKATAVYELLGASGAGLLSSEQISMLEGGAFGLVQGVITSPTHENIDLALVETATALQRVKDALDAMPIIEDFSATQKTNLTTEKSYMSTEITSISSKQQAIGVQKATNASSITTAEPSVNT
ncbi:MAG: biotin/lipoyl-binding protein, partial [Parcubacteria group bacterium]|nr:biotin/lipoyl-binding protein [Parcubacteria group bacterium]